MQSILLEDKTKLTVKGATKILSSTSNQAIIQLHEQNLIVLGQNIEITKLNLENKEVCFSGNVVSIKFSQKAEKKGLIKRIFKWFYIKL